MQNKIITTEQAEQRLDNWLIAQYKKIPHSRIYKAIRHGEVRVNKKRAKPAYRVQAGDQIRMPPLGPLKEGGGASAENAPSRSLRQLLKDRLLFEDDYLLILNKPAGLPVHGGTGIDGGLIEALRFMYPEHPSLELVHRLDRQTSGCLLVAKKRSTLKQLQRQFAEGKIKKQYITLVRGHWSLQRTAVHLPLIKLHAPTGERFVRVNPDLGKPASTQFGVLKHYIGASLLEVFPQTGRTHQIRVHTASSGHPIAGDDKYGDDTFSAKMVTFGVKRLFLHAYSLQFEHPHTQQWVALGAPLDKDLLTALGSLGSMRTP